MKLTAEPRSDQFNAEDFLGGPRTFQIAGVVTGAAEQKYDIQLEGEQRVWRPPVTVLRTLMRAWQSDDSDDWIGKRVTLYCDEGVTFGKETPGGIRVSHVSGINKPVHVNVTEKRGRRKNVTVQPLPEAPAQSTEVPADILATIAKAKEDGNLPAYLEYVKGNNAPAHIVAHVEAELAALKELGADA